MAKSRVVLPVEVGLLRLCAQGLVQGTGWSSAVEVVQGMLAMQGQQVSAFPHAVLARCPEATGSEVAAAFADRTLVRHRPMRGTVHITTAQDFRWLTQVLKGGWSAWEQRAFLELGINQDVIELAGAAAQQAIAEGGGAITRSELYSTWSEQLDWRHLEGEEQKRRWLRCLMYGTMNLGALVEGPMGKNQHLFIDASTLPLPPGVASHVALDSSQRELGLMELARRYIRGHGPVTLEDLVWWAGMRKSTAAQALQSAVEHDPDLGIYQLEDGKLVAKRAAVTANPASPQLFMRNDLPDVLAQRRTEAMRLMFLPSFDEIYVGYANRTCLTDDEGDHLICPARNGMFRPLLVNRGRLIGVRPATGPIEWVKTPGVRLVSQAERLVADTLKRLAN